MKIPIIFILLITTTSISRAFTEYTPKSHIDPEFKKQIISLLDEGKFREASDLISNKNEIEKYNSERGSEQGVSDYYKTQKDIDYLRNMVLNRSLSSQHKADEELRSKKEADHVQFIEDNARREQAEIERQSNIQAHKEALERCSDKPQARLYSAQQEVIEGFVQLAELEAARREERAIEKESGVVNLSHNYGIGRQIVQVKREIKESFKTYRSLGGTAKTPQKVTNKVKYPCEQEEAIVGQDNMSVFRP